MSRHNTQYCVNPETGRNIQIGNKTWARLVRENKIDEGDYKHYNVGYQTEETYEDAGDEVLRQLEEQKQHMIQNGQVPAGKTLSIQPPRKGIRKKGKIVYRDRNLTAHEASKNTADAAMDVIDQIQNGRIQVPSDMNRDEAHNYLQGLIFNKMLTVGKKFKNMKLKPTGAPLAKPPLVRQTAEPAKKYKTIAPKKKVPPKRNARALAPKKKKIIAPVVYEEYEPETEPEPETEYETEQDDTEYETEPEYIYEQ